MASKPNESRDGHPFRLSLSLGHCPKGQRGERVAFFDPAERFLCLTITRKKMKEYGTLSLMKERKLEGK